MSDELKKEIECDDPDCGCHHHHHEDGEHHHHHHGDGEHHHHHHHHDDEHHPHHHHHADGEECDDPDCDCHRHHHSEAEEIAESAMVIGQKRAYHPAAPVARADIEERMKALFLRLGEEISEGGFVLGHLKGSVAAPDGSFYAVSCTRAGTVDVTASAEWADGAALEEYEFTLNILSVIPKDVDIDAAFAELG